MTLSSLGRLGAAAAVLLIALSAFSAPAKAQPIDAFTTSNLNLRAGPGTDYPVVRVAPSGAAVDIYGCLGDLSWCESWYAGQRGWFSARYLYFYNRGQYLEPSAYSRVSPVPRVSFNIDVYWDSYYRGEPFYGERLRWAPRGIHVGVFYDRLAPYGHWVWFQGQYVWIPDVGRGWSPYVEGRWVYTSTYGWMWVSYEPFGWAAYHYGRWGYSNRIGWFWIPGTRWGPAWVAWRQSDDYFAWAPLPPDTAGSAWMQVSYGNIPNYYWQVAPSRSFLSIDISIDIVRDRNRVRALVADTEPAGGVSVANNIVVNNAISPDLVEAATGQDVTVYEVAVTSEAAESGATEGATIEIFQPDVAEIPQVAAPVEVLTVEQASGETATAGVAIDEPTTEELVPPPSQSLEVPPTVAPPVEPLPQQPSADSVAPQTLECPEGTVMLSDGSCVVPPPAPEQPAGPEPVFEAPAPVEPVAEEPAASAPEAPAAPEPAPVMEEPAAEPAPEMEATAVEPAPEPMVQETPVEPSAPQACPEGMVPLEGGQCVPLCPDGSPAMADGSCPVDAAPASEG